MSDQHLSEFSDVRLTDAERAHLRAQLRAYVALRPSAPNAPTRALRWFARHAAAVAVIGLIIIAGGTGVSAERSSPGDLLYGFRVSVNDRIATALAFDDDAQIDTELRQVERMLEEEDAAREDTLGDIAYAVATDDEGDGFERELDAIGNELDDAERAASTVDIEDAQDADESDETFDDGSFETELRGIEQELEAEGAVTLELD